MQVRDVSIHLLQEKLLKDIQTLRAPEGYLYAGYPRYKNPFGRDSLIAAWQLLSINPTIAKDALSYLAMHQATTVDPLADAEPGKILHEYRLDQEHQKELPWHWPYYGSVDSTPLFVMVAGKYARATNDYETIHKLWPNLTYAMQWVTEYGDKDQDGFIEYERQSPHGLFHQGWKDSPDDTLKITPPVAMVEIQGYVYDAYNEYASMADVIGLNRAFSKDLKEKAKKLKMLFHDAFWMEDEQYYAFALDVDKKQQKAVTSNPGHLLTTNILQEKQKRAVVKRLFATDMFTSFGIRTLSDQDPDFEPISYHRGSIWPHDNWMIYQGLLSDFPERADQIKQALLHAYHALEEKIPELYAVTKDLSGNDAIQAIKEIIDLNASANALQAWASGALLHMISLSHE